MLGAVASPAERFEVPGLVAAAVSERDAVMHL
jgi:hypothetical protein